MSRFIANLHNKYKSATPRYRHRVQLTIIAVFFGIIGLLFLVNSFADSSHVTGVVFRDYNGNGVRDNIQATDPSLAADRGVSDITVKGYSEDGQLCDTETTNITGDYILDLGACASEKFRIEFSNLPNGMFPTQIGTDSQSTTQFVASGGTANLGVNRPNEFCENNPRLATSCYSFGGITEQNSNKGAIFGFPFSVTGATIPPITMGTTSQVGTTWGLAYRQSTNTLFSAAFMKRHAGFGPGGPGAIYESPVPVGGSGTTTPNLKATIPNAGSDTHPISDTNCNSVSGQISSNTTVCWARDEFSFSSPGKSGLGGLSILSDPNSPSNDSLLVVNLNDRKIYRVSSLDTVPLTTSYNLPTNLPNQGPNLLQNGHESGEHQTCIESDVRPFALTIYNNLGYVGLVCTAQTSRNSSDLRAYIYSFDPTTMAFNTVPTLEFPLDYGRSCSNGSNQTGCWQRANWLPWIDNFSDTLVNDDKPPLTNGVKILTAPQPILSDISFGSNGSMTISFRDRYGDQMGYQALNTTNGDGTLYAATSTGDILRACLVNDKYVLEDAGLCDGKGPGASGVRAVVDGLPQGPGNYEFYNYDYFADDNDNPVYHDEASQGGLAQVSGFDTIVNSSMNPLRGVNDGAWSGGLRWYSSQDGTKSNAYRLFQSDFQNPVLGTPYFGKANGLGDIVAICNSAPIEIGDLVWRDENRNGVQDANEAPIPNVTVSLVNPAGTVIATATTDTNGNYIFSNRTVDENGNAIVNTPSRQYGITDLTANTQNYRLELKTDADYTNQDRLSEQFLTTANVRANFGNSQNDSKAITANTSIAMSSSNPATIIFSTGSTGANNHTLDFGFISVINNDDTVITPNTPSETTPNNQNSQLPPSQQAHNNDNITSVFANTGQALIASAISAGLIICVGVGYFIWIRRKTN